jgi:hypothetical protein
LLALEVFEVLLWAADLLADEAGAAARASDPTKSTIAIKTRFQRKNRAHPCYKRSEKTLTVK